MWKQQIATVKLLNKFRSKSSSHIMTWKTRRRDINTRAEKTRVLNAICALFGFVNISCMCAQWQNGIDISRLWCTYTYIMLSLSPSLSLISCVVKSSGTLFKSRPIWLPLLCCCSRFPYIMLQESDSVLRFSLHFSSSNIRARCLASWLCVFVMVKQQSLAYMQCMQ